MSAISDQPTGAQGATPALSADAPAAVLWAEIERLRDALATARQSLPDDLRRQGWTVAVHNDYRLHNQPHTFWLMTRQGRCIKGEGRTDAEALNLAREQAAQELAKSVITTADLRAVCLSFTNDLALLSESEQKARLEEAGRWGRAFGLNIGDGAGVSQVSRPAAADREYASLWRDNAFEQAALIAERYGCDPWCARDIRALQSAGRISTVEGPLA